MEGSFSAMSKKARGFLINRARHSQDRDIRWSTLFLVFLLVSAILLEVFLTCVNLRILSRLNQKSNHQLEGIVMQSRYDYHTLISYGVHSMGATNHGQRRVAPCQVFAPNQHEVQGYGKEKRADVRENHVQART